MHQFNIGIYKAKEAVNSLFFALITLLYCGNDRLSDNLMELALLGEH